MPLFVAILTVRGAELDAFRAYEHAAARIMARHHGAIERALVLDDGGETLRELHVVRLSSSGGPSRRAVSDRAPSLRAGRPLRRRA